MQDRWSRRREEHAVSWCGLYQISREMEGRGSVSRKLSRSSVERHLFVRLFPGQKEGLMLSRRRVPRRGMHQQIRRKLDARFLVFCIQLDFPFLHPREQTLRSG